MDRLDDMNRELDRLRQKLYDAQRERYEARNAARELWKRTYRNEFESQRTLSQWPWLEEE